jgi:hypothetical protein
LKGDFIMLCNSNTADHNLNKQSFERFKFYELSPYNTIDAVNLPISTDTNNPTQFASLNIHADSDDNVWLTSTVGWQADGDAVALVIFKIWRDTVGTGGAVIFSAEVGGLGTEERNYISSFSHVDTNLPRCSRQHSYFLTAELDPKSEGLDARIIGPVTFTAAAIDS